MTEAVVKTVQCISPAGLHSMAYKEWGDPRNPNVLVCVHGVTRVADDFDRLARELCDTYRVVCPDIVGRGRSARLANPQFYTIPQYVSDMVTLLARLDAELVDWFGTSMGGLIGMVLGSMPDSPIHKLVLNDIGPSINGAALARIGDYIGQDVRFDTFDEAAHYIRTISASFGHHSDEEWHKLAADVLRQNEQGQWIRHYDLALALPFKSSTPEAASAGEQMLWAAYDALRCPTLLVRGAQSDLLLPDTAQQMTRRGPHATLVEVPDVGHAPTFMHAAQIEVAKKFLLG
ncbi:alpha/beta fold hydrolase [Herbaspirillum sp. YR522]|uniref:alpha/beta fold hydrolase n=1 Tax=Herbaspirillum sp. YR522 TaxID=1144342 RepID=UPI00026F7F61|nr:alpha/beta hydrolase [Herbaspirillum sp. YR522]EJN08121.1 putative hydrolase or acyltransferase of alpha/beta superfamily [Herbaspirillum sp. YR522]